MMTELQGRSRPRQKRPRSGTRQDSELLPGRFLLAGVDSVLSHLPPAGQLPTPQVVEELRVALARTAACGQTCQVASAADTVRLATSLLLAGSTDEACQALRHARTALVAPSDGGSERGQATV